MRKIKTSDVFKLSRLIKECGLQDEIKSLYEESKGQSAESVGFDAIFRMMATLTTEEAEMKIYAFYGDIVGRSAEDVADTDLNALADEMALVAKENDLKRFFGAAAKLIQ